MSSRARWASDTTTYEHVVNTDRTIVHIVERYHTPVHITQVQQMFMPFAERFLQLARVEKAPACGDYARPRKARQLWRRISDAVRQLFSLIRRDELHEERS
jgi:hypothetical protein